MAPDERVYEATRSFLEDHPDCEPALNDLLAVDEGGAWGFDDVDLDSGRFGTLVSAGIADKVDGDYRLADRAAVRAAIEGEPIASSEDAGRTFDVALPSIDAPTALSLLVALASIAVVRSTQVGKVFRHGEVVSPGNDPYFYRWMQYRLLELSSSPTDLTPITDVPSRAASRPLTHAVNWWLATALGGSPDAADQVAAWLPVVGSVALGVVLYLLATRLTGDRRIGVAAVVLLAVTPLHAGYTSLGFLEHRVHQYFWLGVLALGLAWPAVDLRRRLVESDPRSAVRAHLRGRSAWVSVGLVAVAVPTSAFAWRGSALTFLPVAAYLGLKVAIDVRRGVSPAGANAAVLVGLWLGAVLTYGPHARWGWQEADALLVFAPAMVAAVGMTFVAIGEGWSRTDWHVGGCLALEALTGVLTLLVVRYARPDLYARAVDRMGDLLFRENIVEVVSLFSLESAVVFGPLMVLGLGFYLALPTLGWFTWTGYRGYEPGQLVPVVFAWYYLVLATIQLRFAAQLAIFLAYFAGLTLVAALAWVDAARWPAVFRDEDDGTARADRGSDERDGPLGISLDGVTREHLLVVGLLGGIVVGLTAALAFGMTAQVMHDASFEAAMAIDEYADVHGDEAGEGYVLSSWGDNRMYNFFVTGEAAGYGYARGNYGSFLSTAHPDEAYDGYGNRVGFVVVESMEAPAESTQATLYDDLGVGDEPATHYRLLYAGEDLRAFALVEGAVLQVNATSGEEVSATTEVSVGDERVTYRVSATVDESGRATLRVPYPGTYSVVGTEVDVSDAEVQDGATIEVGT